jgi:threonine aldolase
MTKGGGCIYDFEEILKISRLCQDAELKMHLDGARLFNAIVETDQKPKDFGAVFDTISICLSKGLGAPIGSLILMKDAALKYEAKRLRKAFGGGMRQVGFLAAAGQYALDEHIERLKEDHQRCEVLAKCLESKPWVQKVLPVETNILIFQHDLDDQKLIAKMAEQGILVVGMGRGLIRMVTHLDFGDDDLEVAESIIRKL